MLDEKKADLPGPGRANTWGAWSLLLAATEGLAVLGERDEAAKLYPLTLEAMGGGACLRWWFGPVETVAGIAAAAGAQWEKAEEHYQKALRVAHEMPVVIAQPEARRWYARMLIDRDGSGDREKARALLAEAIAMYRQIGMPKHVDMAEALLREL
jgi:tetratricopeptide (TPR) repeat protein